MGNWLSDNNMNKKNKRGMSKQEFEEKYEFPATLDEFGYYFNNDGKLRNKENDEPFEFAAKPDNHKYNQKRYEALGDIITEHIYYLMEKNHKLKKHYIPESTPDDEPRSFVFHTEDVFTNEKMIILIHGSGAVRAGQWARRLIINDCLDSGTQLPFISRAIDRGYSVVVANTNINKETIDGEDVEIKGNSSPEEHVETLWSEIVQRSKAKHIGIVAHSYGGVCTLELVNNHMKEFQDKVFAIALTDSVHSFSHQTSTEELISFYKQRARNWASAYDPLDAHLETRMDFCPTVSAGTDHHDYTSYSSMKSIFIFLEERYAEHTSTNEKSKSKLQSDKNSSLASETSQPEPKVNNEPMSQDKTESSDVSQKPTLKMASETSTDTYSQGQDEMSQNTMVSPGSQQEMSQDTVGSPGSQHEMSQDTVGSPGSQQEMNQGTVGSPGSQQEMSQDTVASPGSQQEMSQDTVEAPTSPQQNSEDEQVKVDTTKRKEEL